MSVFHSLTLAPHSAPNLLTILHPHTTCPCSVSADDIFLPQTHPDIYETFALSISKGLSAYDLIQLDHIMILAATRGAFAITIIQITALCYIGDTKAQGTSMTRSKSHQ